MRIETRASERASERERERERESIDVVLVEHIDLDS